MALTSGALDTTGTEITDPDLHKVARWLAEIALYERETEAWNKRRVRIVKRYRDERSPQEDNVSRFNVLWANTQTLQPALYAKNPKPDIARRFKDEDPVGRVTSDVLERSVSYFTDRDQFSATMRQDVLDYLLPGRATLWVRYVPTMRKADLEVTDDVQEGDQAQPPVEEIAFEEVIADYVHPDDFGHNICRTWDEVYVCWRRVFMDRQELVARFGEEKGNLVPLDYKAKDIHDTTLDNGVSKAVIYEAWDKKRKVAVWFHKTIPDALDLRPDPLKLEGFFPCPKPLFANLANDSLIPTPDYVEYQDQAKELDDLTAKIHSITKSLKVAGVYDASAQGISRLLAEGTQNELIPVESWAALADKGGLQGSFALLPMEQIATTLQTLYLTREQVKKDLHEISGIPDILRGQTDANETLGAQEIKTSFATNRISDKQRDVQRFVRETIRIMVDIMCGHFQPETIKTISGVRLFHEAEKQQLAQAIQTSQTSQQPPPLPKGIPQDQVEQMMQDPSWEEVFALIKDQPMRSFRIDIETDSIIRADEEQEKASRVEFLKASGEFLQQAVAAGAQAPEMVPLLGRMLMFGVRAFPIGKELEGAFNSTIQKMEKAAANPQPKQDPEMAKVQAQTQLQQQQQQFDQQHQQAQLQGQMQLEQMKMQFQAQTEQAKAQAQAAVDQHLNQVENERRMAELQAETQMKQLELEHSGNIEIQKAHIMAAASIEVARINAKADDGAAAEAREASGE